MNTRKMPRRLFLRLFRAERLPKKTSPPKAPAGSIENRKAAGSALAGLSAQGAEARKHEGNKEENRTKHFFLLSLHEKTRLGTSPAKGTISGESP